MREAVEILKSVITPGLSGFSKYSKITVRLRGQYFHSHLRTSIKQKARSMIQTQLHYYLRYCQEQRPDDNAEDDFPPD